MSNPVTSRLAGVHERLFRRYFDAIIGRLDTMFGQLEQIRHDIEFMRGSLDEVDRRTRERVATEWDATAMARRLAALEDRVEAVARRQGEDARSPR